MEKGTSYKILKRYLKELVVSTYARFFGGIEVFAFLIDITTGGRIPKNVYLWIFLIGLIISNYIIYQDLLRENENLNEQINCQKERIPEIHVSFLKENDITKVLDIALKKIPNAPDFDQLIEKEQERLLNELVTHKQKIEINSRLDMNWIFLKEFNSDYEKDINNYLPEYRKYLIELYYFSIHKTHLLPLTPIIRNSGNKAAENIHIEFYFPRILRVANENEIGWLSGEEGFNKPKKPIEPILYKNSFDINVSSFPMINNLPNIQRIPQDIEGPVFEKETNIDNIFLYKIKLMNPKYSEENLDPIYLWFDQIKKTSMIDIPIIVYASNLPNKEECTLKVEINFI